jgi:hypothetical protein
VVWISKQNQEDTGRTDKTDHTFRTLILAVVGTPLAIAASYGKFGLALQPIGILLSVPLMFITISLVIGAPWIGLMWIGSYCSHLSRKYRNRKRSG